jgi:hypothetical protein
MDSIASEPVPCPNCGSRKARWRNRRPYDILFTWLRSFADASLATILGGGWARSAGRRYSAPDEVYDRARAAYELKVGFVTAARFWRCPDCKQRGQIFSGLDDVLSTRRAHLASIENGIRGHLGGIGDPVDRDGIPDD